jgi:hypothetical protein
MAANKYFDAIGQSLSYVLSAEDSIQGQIDDSSGIQFVIKRDGTLLDLYAVPNNRYFTLVYYFDIRRKIAEAYDKDGELFQKHQDEFDYTDLSDEKLYTNMAILRTADIDREDTKKVESDIRGVASHTGCRFNSLKEKHPEKEGTEIWNGFAISGLLYPYEADYSPRHYEQTAQEVISVGKQIDQAMKKLDVMKEIGFEP